MTTKPPGVPLTQLSENCGILGARLPAKAGAGASYKLTSLLFTAMRCIFTSTYEIEANSEKEAIAKLLEDSQDFARQAEVEKIEDRPFSTTSPAPPWAVQRI